MRSIHLNYISLEAELFEVHILKSLANKTQNYMVAHLKMGAEEHVFEN